jgi:hypothetical protein
VFMDIGTNKMTLEITIHDAITGESVTRLMTEEEIATLFPNGVQTLENTDETPSAD